MRDHMLTPSLRFLPACATQTLENCADEDAEEEYRKVHKALNLLRHVQASTKLPQCLQPPKRPQLTLHSTPVPAVNTASTGNNNNNNSSSSSSAGGSMALDAATSKPSTAAAGSETPAGDGVDVLLTARRSSSTNDSHSSAAGKLHLPLGACTSSASFSNGPKSSRAPTQQPHHQPHRSRSFTSPAAAAAAAGAPSSGAAPGAPARRHTNGAAAAIASSSAAVPLAALYEPTLEDLKPYLKGALSGEGVEAFIQRRLQQPPDVACQAGAKLAKLPATQRYMATIAVEHKQRQQLQRLPSAAAGEQRRQHG
jgi:hypothetical protein